MVERAGSSRARRRSSSTTGSSMPVDAPTLNKARWCRRRLLAWYERHGRQFPWRSSNADLYQRVVAEILLQRTQAATVSQFFDSFFQKLKSWDDIDAMPIEQLENVLRPIGLWRRRATALKALAREMVGRAGSFPASRDELESLPAVGQYVASAVLLFAYKRAEPLLDGSMARVIERVFEPRRLVDIRYDSRLQALARILVRSRDPEGVNWALLDVAARSCVPQAPRCDDCPLRRRCNYAMGTHIFRTGQGRQRRHGELLLHREE